MKIGGLGETLFEGVAQQGESSQVRTLTGLCPGVYTYSILKQYMVWEDGSPMWSIVKVGTVTILGPDQYLSANMDVNNGNCVGTGSLKVTAQNGNPPYTYYWDGFDEYSATLPNIGNGTYTCRITDSKGCVYYITGTISGQGGPVDFTLTVEQPECSLASWYGSATVSNITGTSNYTITWLPNDPGGNATSRTNLEPGVYFVVVKDNVSGCVMLKAFRISQRLLLRAAAMVKQPGCDGDPNSGRIELYRYQGNGEPYTFTWTPNVSTTNVAENLPPGTYTVTITDALGCTWERTFVLASAPPVEFAILGKSYRNSSNQCMARASLIITGGTPPYRVVWESPSECVGNACEVPAPATFRVRVIDANGCSSVQEITVNAVCTTRVVGVSPNPFWDPLDIQYVLEAPNSVKFRVYNSSFTLEDEINLGTRNTGTHNDVLNLAALANGVYYLNLVLDGVPETFMTTVVKQ